MREHVFASLILLAPAVYAQVVPSGWQIIKDSKNVCQLAVPADWTPFRESVGAATLTDSSTAMAVVTSQPDQAFRPLPESVMRVIDVPKDRVFENSAKRIFYQDKVSKTASETNSYSFSVPGKAGTCSGHLTWAPAVTEEVARKIALSLGPLTEAKSGSN
jgi:hypothetical protein